MSAGIKQATLGPVSGDGIARHLRKSGITSTVNVWEWVRDG